MDKTIRMATGLLAVVLIASAGAAIVTDMKTSGVTASATDLINNGQYRSAVEYSGGPNAGSWAYLTDGIIDQWNGYGYKDVYSTYFLYTLDTMASPTGYTISSIALTSGWNAESYCSQRYTLQVHQVGAGSEWITLVNDGIFTYNNWYLQTITYNTTGAALATNVDQVSLYLVGSENGGYTSVLYELDVAGSIPEPASFGLLLLGSLAVLRRR